MEVEIGRGKKARRAYGFDDIAIVPSRRTRDPDDVDISWTLGPSRFEDADEQLERIASFPAEVATREMQAIYRAPIRPELIGRRIEEIKAQGGVVAASLTPQRVREYYEIALEAGLDILVIQGTVISAEHVSTVVEPLNLKEFIREVPVPVVVGGCASYSTGLHLMRTGAAGVLVG